MDISPSNSTNNSPSKTINPDNFSWRNLGQGLIGSLVGSTIEGIGIGAAALIRTPKAAYTAMKSLWATKTLGPVLKTTLLPGVIAAIILAPEIAILGGILHGMFAGFAKGASKPLAVPQESAKNVRYFYTTMVDDALQGLTEWSVQKPERIYEIKVLEAIQGLAAGMVGFFVVGLGVGASTARFTPRTFFDFSRELWCSGVVLPLAVGGQLLLTVALVLAVPLALSLGALAGLGLAAYRGYSKGFLSSVGHTFKDVERFYKTLGKTVKGR